MGQGPRVLVFGEATMSSEVAIYDVLIREHHLDSFGHVNNAVYLELFEEARWELITQRGYGLEKVRETGLGPTILEINVRFMREMRLRDKIRIKTSLKSHRGKIMVLHQLMEREDGKVCCEADFTVALFDTTLRKLVEPTAEWLEAVSGGK